MGNLRWSPAKAARRLLAWAGALACARGAAAQAPPYAIASWGTEQGLPSNIALNVRQTRDGYLWIASYQGLVRFDGVSFRTFSEADIPGLTRASFWRVAADSAGALWGASETSGLVRHAGGRWTVFHVRDGLKSDKVTTVVPDHGGVVWVGTRGGVSRVQGGRIEPLPAPRGLPEPSVTDLARDGQGNLWIGTVASGLLRYRDGVYTPVSVREGLPDGRISSIWADVDGSVWVGTYEAGVVHIRDGVLTRVAAEGAGAPRRVNEVRRDPRGVLWLAADNGLFRMEGDRAVPVTLPDGRPISQAAALHCDGDGNLWVGSRQGGLLRVRVASVTTLRTANGLPHDLVSAVAGDGAGGVWLATHGGVAHRTANGIEVFSRENGRLRDNIARDLIRARNGDVWVATNGGLTRLRGGTAVTFTARDGLPDDGARALLEDASGALWIGTYNGLSELRDGRFRTHGTAQGLIDPYILSVFQDRRGTLWVGTQSEGLFRRVGDRFVRGPAALAHLPVFRVTEDDDGTLWVGSTRGLARLRGDSVVIFTMQNGLPGNAVFQALDDGRGRLWLTGPWGVGHVRREELDAVAEGRAQTLTVKQYGSKDGMAAREASSISRAWRAPDGTLWFATPAGAALIDPAGLMRNARPPVTLVERVVVDDSVFDGGGAIVVPPGARKLEFHFTATSFVAPEQIRFRYRLDGYDDDWVEGGTRRVAYYTNLPPGRYRFRVDARNEDGVMGQAAASVPVTLRPYFWQTRWFLAIAAAVLALLIYAAHRLRVSMVQHTLREQMLRDLSLHDDLTGLYNRRGLFALAEQQVRTSERQRRGFDVVFVDLDGLKRINDTFGHPQGDLALCDTAMLLRRTFRDSDVIARLAGDEFAVLVLDDPLVDGVEPGEGVDQVCGRLMDAVAHHNQVAGRPYQLSISLGYSAFDPLRPTDLEGLLAAADELMYKHKRSKQLARA